MSHPLRSLRRQALGLEAAGFLLLILTSWLDEYLDLPRLLFHAQPTTFRPEEWLFESALLILVAALTLTFTAVLLRRLAYERSFVALCAWCHRVRRGDEWETLAVFLKRERGDELSHGMGPGCSARLERGEARVPAGSTAPGPPTR